MTKSQKRALAHQQRQAAQSAWRPVSIELGPNGCPEFVQTRTRREERQHEEAMYRWWRNGGGGDNDHSMDY